MHDDVPHQPSLTPAPLGPRIAAGAVDAAAIFVLSGLLLWLTTRLLGGSLPLLAFFAVVLGWAVIPIWVFGATLPMRLFGVEIVDRRGTPTDLLEILFREMIGRGWFAVAYLGTLFVGLVGMITGRAAFTMPVGLSLLFTVLAVLILGVTNIGHVLVLARDDRRGLADLLAQTTVIPRRTAALPTDAEDREWAEVRRRTRIRNVAVAEVVLLAVTLAVPFVFTLEMPSIDPYAAGQTRPDLDSLRRTFEANPASSDAAGELLLALMAEDEDDEAEAVRQRHDAAVAAAAHKREAMLRARLEAAPTDLETLSLLVEELEEQERLEEAVTAYRAFVEAVEDPGYRAGFGIWLYRRERNAEAITELDRAIEGGLSTVRVHAYRGFALEDENRLEEAAASLAAALELDPEQDEVRRALERIEGALAPDDGGY